MEVVVKQKMDEVDECQKIYMASSCLYRETNSDKSTTAIAALDF